MHTQGDFPMFKLIALLARQMSSPIASRIKTYAKNHPVFSRVICQPPARIYHFCDEKYKMWLLNLGKNATVSPLTNKQALEMGGDILGEVVLFGIGALIIMFELARQAELQEAKVLNEKSRRVALMCALEELSKELILQQNEMEQLCMTLKEAMESSCDESKTSTARVYSKVCSVSSKTNQTNRT